MSSKIQVLNNEIKKMYTVKVFNILQFQRCRTTTLLPIGFKISEMSGPSGNTLSKYVDLNILSKILKNVRAAEGKNKKTKLSG